MTHTLSRRTALTAGLAAVVAAAVGGCGAPDPAEPRSGGAEPGADFDAATVQTLDRLMGAKIGDAAAPGGVLGVWVGGRGALRKGYGVADLGTGEPMTPDHGFRIASITKTFAAGALILLAERGGLTLDDTLARYVPAVANADRITLRQLLDMTAGVFNFTADEQFLAGFDRDPTAPFGVDRVLEVLGRHQPSFAPGEPGRWEYSDTNYVLLDPVIRSVSGASPGDFIEQDVAKPLGLARTSYPTSPDLPSGCARGYTDGVEGGPPRDISAVNPDVPGPAGAMVSTVDDLWTWVGALADGSLYRDGGSKAAQQAFVPAIRSGPVPVDYGLGMMRINGMVGHNGAIYGFNSAVLRHPASDATFVVALNKSTNDESTALEVALDAAKVLFPDGFGG
ncbi:serine hydrolase domain-containing protein [Umezawaea sp. Da 62-37]|uniref:serine hydrolase domain-containing protein n=1 Tax=Umezawaea sp. Da 62-37 TaxID=3075927 RepID=UPI0028F6CE75|nr:serine hydrolase domain-containing protein [Umezawaea sp. Da 62-37]WNV87937.1 serine hydrolase domain-containing protein [Umezawaea sp. Da 62-37]